MKRINQLLISIAILLSLFFVYRSYQAYKNYQIIQQSDLYVHLLGNLQKSIHALESERLSTALYLGYKGNTNFGQLANIREKSDQALQELFSYLSSNEKLADIKASFSHIHEDLRYVRSRVDVINDDYKTILIDYYHTKIVAPLLKDLHHWVNKLSLSVETIAPYFHTYKALTNFIDTQNQEQSFIAYKLAAYQEMTMPDLVIWETILNQEEIPDITPLSQKPIYHLLDKTVQTKLLEERLTTLRRNVLRGSNNGNYTLQAASWIAQIQQNIDAVQEAQQTLFDYIKSLDFKSIVPVKLYINIGFFLLLLGILFWLIKRQQNLRPIHKRILDEDNPDIKIKHDTDIETLGTQNTLVANNETAILIDSEELLELADGDLPLTNITVSPTKPKTVVKKEEKIKEDQEVIQKVQIKETNFSPIELFKEVIKPFIYIAQQRNIAFHYAIDPSLPQVCIGDREKIKEIATLILNYAIQSTSSRKTVTMKIENVAQKKFETALSFRIKDPSSYIPKEEQRHIRKGEKPAHILPSGHEDLFKAGKLVKQVGGSLRMESDRSNGTEFAVSINLKRFIPTDQ